MLKNTVTYFFLLLGLTTLIACGSSHQTGNNNPPALTQTQKQTLADFATATQRISQAAKSAYQAQNAQAQKLTRQSRLDKPARKMKNALLQANCNFKRENKTAPDDDPSAHINSLFTVKGPDCPILLTRNTTQRRTPTEDGYKFDFQISDNYKVRTASFKNYNDITNISVEGTGSGRIKVGDKREFPTDLDLQVNGQINSQRLGQIKLKKVTEVSFTGAGLNAKNLIQLDFPNFTAKGLVRTTIQRGQPREQYLLNGKEVSKSEFQRYFRQLRNQRRPGSTPGRALNLIQ